MFFLSLFFSFNSASRN